MEKHRLTQIELLELFDYKQGNLIWKKDRYGYKAGDIAGYVHSKRKYAYVTINKVRYLVHRLIYIFFYGYAPDMIDHIDLDKSNNRIENLRPATYFGNNQNKKVRKDSSTKVKGVQYLAKHNRFWARITAYGKTKSLGYHKTIEEAAKAYEQAARELHKDFARNV